MDVLKSSRFWMSVVASVGAFVLAALGKVSGEMALSFVAGLVAGFGVAKTKRLGALPAAPVSLLLGLVLLVAGCGGWQTKTRTGLELAFQVAKTTSDVVHPVLHERCLEAAKECKAKLQKEAAASQPRAATPETCPEVQKCLVTKHKVTAIVVGIHRLIVAGLLAVTIGEEKGATDWMKLVQQEISNLRSLIDSLKVFDIKLGPEGP